jgi:superfamily II DNA/RNA helicase
MLCRVDPLVHETQALCLCPSRELARQIIGVIRQMGQFTDISYETVLRETCKKQYQHKHDLYDSTFFISFFFQYKI